MRKESMRTRGMHKNHLRIPSSSQMLMKLLIFVLLSSVLFDLAFGEAALVSTTGRRGVLSADDESSFDLLDKEDAPTPNPEEEKMNSWIDFCSSSARELYESCLLYTSPSPRDS